MDQLRKSLYRRAVITILALSFFADPTVAQNCTGRTNSYVCTSEEGCCWDDSNEQCVTFCPIDSKIVQFDYKIVDVSPSASVTTIRDKVQQAMSTVVSGVADIDVVRMGPLLVDNCGSAPLCGDPDQPLDPFAPNVIFFQECCPLNETTKTEECQVTDPVKSCRTATSTTPFCREVDNCGERDARLLIDGLRFRVNPEEVCCDTCVCYGDPRCTSFNGTQDIWALCDARGPRSNSNKKCKIQESVCMTQKDHENNQCQWLDDEKFNTAKSVGKFGSQCVQNVNSSDSTILMYSADTYRLVPRHAERGVIDKVSLTLGDVSYSMNATACVFEGRDAWDIQGGSTILPSYFKRTELVREQTESINILWLIQDPATNILTKVRCVAVYYDDMKDFGLPRINVEGVVEPNANYLNTRANLGGFCVTGSLEKTGSTNVTDAVENSDDYCKKYTGLEEVAVARQICDETVMRTSVSDCFDSFCSKYYFFAYDTFAECSELAQDDFGRVFCSITTMDQSNYRKCLDEIDDFDWESAVSMFLKPFLNATSECTNLDDEELPTTIGNCTDGVALQYQPEFNGDWETFVFFPASRPPCEGEVEYTYNERTKPLFDFPIRLIQCSAATVCSGDLCKQAAAVNASLTFSIGSRAPTASPSVRTPQPPSPTRSPANVNPPFPTNSPSPEPTSAPTATRAPNEEPTKNPTTSPTETAAPTNTQAPTVSGAPTRSPTMLPTTTTASPSTPAPSRGGWSAPSPPTAYVDPTMEPTMSPTSAPTKKQGGWSAPVVKPTDAPTDLPTGRPRQAVTSEPTTSPTSSPTKSPTKLPTDSPTSEPTSSPTSQPTKSPTGSPTLWPTNSPTAKPTEAPTLWPSYSPTDWPSYSPSDKPSAAPTESPTTEAPTSSPTRQDVPFSEAPTSSPSSKPGGWSPGRILSRASKTVAAMSGGRELQGDSDLTIIGSTSINFDTVEAAQSYAQREQACADFMASYNNDNPVGRMDSCKMAQAESSEGVPFGLEGSVATEAAGISAGGIVGIVFGSLFALYLILLVRKNMLGPKSSSTEII